MVLLCVDFTVLLSRLNENILRINISSLEFRLKKY